MLPTKEEHPLVSLRKYIASEKFIHDGLVKDAQVVVERIYKIWKERRTVRPSLLLWPAQAVQADDGSLISHIVAADLPDDVSAHKDFMRAAADRVNAYAVLVVRKEGTAVKAILETPHGTRSWTIPIVRSADVFVLGRPTIKNDKDVLGIVWSAQKGSS